MTMVSYSKGTFSNYFLQHFTMFKQQLQAPLLPGAAPSQMEARVAPGQDLTGAAMATFLYDRLVAEEAG